jgi:molecular chaperone DnaK
VFAEEDKNKKTTAETRNQADSLIYQTEKTLNDLGDKVPEGDAAQVNEAKDALKKAMDGQDLDLIKQKTEDLTRVLYDLTSKVYQQTGAQQQSPDGEAGAQGGEKAAGSQDEDPTVDADYKVVDDEPGK